MAVEINIGEKLVGDGNPTYVVAEIGINHNGDIEIAKELIRKAKHAGVDAVKFQKRTPESCVPKEQQSQMRETPWGYISYLDYRRKVEFDQNQYSEIDKICKDIGMNWFVSVWDEDSVDFMEQFSPICYKMANRDPHQNQILEKVKSTGRPIILSTGMSTQDEISEAVKVVGFDNLLITHSTSAYPCDPWELNLKMIQTLQKQFKCPIGYSGHEVGLVTTVIAVAMGACLVERHFTLDRAMWGSDQAASVEPGGFERLVKYIRVAEQSLGDGVKKVYSSELPSLRKLRRVK